MKTASIVSLILFFLITSVLPTRAKNKPFVFVSILPQKYFVQQIGKDLVDVEVMVLPGANPATYEPKPVQMTQIANAKAYFSIGVPFEKVWLKKISSANADMVIVPTDEGIKKLAMARHQHENGQKHQQEASPHNRGSRHHNGFDPHIWLSPPLVILQARIILTTLQDLDPHHQAAYESNYHAFIKETMDLDSSLKKTFADIQGLKFMVFHPSWGYFAHAYGLEQIPIEIEGKEPKPAQLANLIKHARGQKIHTVFVQPQFSTKSAEQIAKAINGHVVVADPLALNWPENLNSIAKAIKATLK